MTTLARYGTRLTSLFPQPQLGAFTLAMVGVLYIQAAGLQPQTVAGLALFHRRGLFAKRCASPGSRDGIGCRPLKDFQETTRRGLGGRAALGPRRLITPKISPAI
jgi:hypothetical protein